MIIILQTDKMCNNIIQPFQGWISLSNHHPGFHPGLLTFKPFGLLHNFILLLL
jgi:hypothetical protein